MRLFIFLLYTVSILNAQTDSPPLVTDRPDQTESAVVVDPGFIQIETGALLETEAVSLATTLLRIGLLKPLEVRITGEYVMESGVNGLSLGGKLRLPGKSAVLIHFQRTGEAKLLLAMAHSLTDRLDFSYNLGHEFGDGAALTYTSAVGIGMGQRGGTFVEIFGDVSREGETSLQFDAGFTYLLKPNLQIDASGGISLVKDFSDWFFSAGMTMRLPR